jgi:hypothetical protein
MTPQAPYAIHPNFPRTTSPPQVAGLAGPINPMHNTPDWGNLFAGPLDDATFAALDASGILGPPGVPSSLPLNVQRNQPHAHQSLPYPANHPANPAPRQGPSHTSAPWDSLPSSFTSSSLRGNFPGKQHSVPAAQAPSPIYTGKGMYCANQISTTVTLTHVSGPLGLHPDYASSRGAPGAFGPLPAEWESGTPSHPPLWLPSGQVPSGSASPARGGPSDPGHPSVPRAGVSIDNGSAPSTQMYRDPGALLTPTDEQAPVFSDYITDGIFPDLAGADSPVVPSFTPSSLSASPELLAGAAADPEAWMRAAMQGHAGGKRMENLTGQMMSLALMKKKEEESAAAAAAAAAAATSVGADVTAPTTDLPGENRTSPPMSADTQMSTAQNGAEASRGRSMGKGKAKIHVVGFDDGTQDGADEEP